MNALLLLIPDFLRVLATIPTVNTALTPKIDGILTLAANLIEQGEAGAQAFEQFANDIRSMVTAQREPTDAEWAALKARSDAASTDIQSVAHSASSSEPSP